MFEWIRGVIESLGYAGVAVLTFLENVFPPIPSLVIPLAGYVTAQGANMPAASFITFSLLGTAMWTAALAYAGVVLQANFAIVGDWINVATNVALAIFVVLMVRRYVNCWRSSSVRRPAGKRVGA